MASSYFKLKVLRRKRRALQAKLIAPAIVNTELCNEDEYMDTTIYSKCRICLSDGSIFIYTETSELKNSIEIFGGINLSEDKKLPQYLCNDCHTLLESAVLFRKKAQETDTILKQKDFSQEPNHVSVEVIKIRNNNSEQIQRCDTCKIDFRSLHEFVQHKNTKEHRSVRILCSLCNGLITAQYYRRHLMRHRSVSNIVCEICGKLYSKNNLVKHLQLHSFELPFKCKICPYRGRFPGSLKIHMRTHTGQRPFPCSKCELKFLTKSNLNRHFMTHNKQRSHKCKECEKSFYTLHDMNTHFVANHECAKQFECNTCGYIYATKKALLRHELKVHKRDKMPGGRMPLYLQTDYNNSQVS